MTCRPEHELGGDALAPPLFLALLAGGGLPAPRDAAMSFFMAAILAASASNFASVACRQKF